MLTNWKKPYEVRYAGTVMKVFHTFELVYEDTVLASGTDREQLDRICGMLNGAFNLGRIDHMMEAGIDEFEEDLEVPIRELTGGLH